MKKDIPQIEFNPATIGDFGIEIISIEKITQNKEQYTHNPELPHQLKFYNLIFLHKVQVDILLILIGILFNKIVWFISQKNKSMLLNFLQT